MWLTPPMAWPERISGFRSGVINSIIDALDSLRPISSPTVRHEWRSDGTVSHAGTGDGGSSDPYAWLKILRFGYSINTTDAAKVDVKAGSIFKDKITPLSVAATTITITTLSYIYVEADIPDLTAGTIQVQAPLPVSDDTYFRRPLFRFNLSGGAAVISELCWTGGNIDLTTIYGKNT